MIYMICNKDSSEICGRNLSTGVEGNLAGGSVIFVLDEWVAKIDLLANRSTHWPVG